jgi:hypothetical protein
VFVTRLARPLDCVSSPYGHCQQTSHCDLRPDPQQRLYLPILF